MFISVAVCETDKVRIGLLRDLLAGMSVRHDFELQIYWLYGRDMENRLLELSDCLNLVLISAELSGVAGLGQALYNANPSCYILFYRQREGTIDLEPLLVCRPAGFQAGLHDPARLEEKLVRLCTELWQQKNFFRYQSRSFCCLLPYGSIAYFESDYKYINLHTVSGRTLRLCDKLDDLEQGLGKGPFLRVHKSFLVNMPYAEGLDRVAHVLHLKTGDVIPVSKAYYERTLRVFGNR